MSSALKVCMSIFLCISLFPMVSCLTVSDSTYEQQEQTQLYALQNDSFESIKFFYKQLTHHKSHSDTITAYRTMGGGMSVTLFNCLLFGERQQTSVCLFFVKRGLGISPAVRASGNTLW